MAGTHCRFPTGGGCWGMGAKHQEAALIEINVQSVSQLFNSMDPSPFHERDLDHDAEEFIVSWAQEHPKSVGFKLVLHVREAPEMRDAAQVLPDSIHHFFAYKAEMNRRDFHRLMREGWHCLLIGLSFLGTCVALSHALKPAGASWQSIVSEGLTIMGWVAMWRPLEIYLYRWWPVRALGRIYERLSQMPVDLRMPGAGALPEGNAAQPFGNPAERPRRQSLP